MGRGYIVEDAVEGYLSELCGQNACPVSGLLIGQSSVQRNFVVMAIRTPEKEESTAAHRNSLDKEWVTEHARQVSRMLPGGLSVLGFFIIDENDAKDAVTTLQYLVFAVENLISSEHLCDLADEDITDRVTLHINPKTRKVICRTVDIRDQKEQLMLWANQIGKGAFLIDGQKLPEDAELTTGQKRSVTQAFTAQLLVTPDKRTTDVVQQCEGSISVRGAINGTAFLHSNKPKARLAEKLLKKDVVSTVFTRIQMLLEELQISEEEGSDSSRDRNKTDLFYLPCRVYCPLKLAGPVCVCDYQFSDEGLSEVTDRLKEMLDIDVAVEDLDHTHETLAKVKERDVIAEPAVGTTEVQKPNRNNFLGVAMATAIALLATAASMLYLSEV